ncbi:hypothetical protein L249_3865 [Ophiocordyceps polyrhachis-furcata BCC 54312]|uniref:Uncharacterized protein n=1 Tax=Ophiocordyceps polyrhachis-furcata BCC 54312 TaxID=1330021 RepID=A0A367L621_9HYPO|nr:hypothetical protein L249_3865 [Ophiocordyceps polyrhachis-furcata BCC 54312]
MGKKWVCLLKSVGKVESNKVFYRAVEEEEGGEKLVEMEMIISNQGVDYVIEKKKTNYVMVVLSNKVKADNKLEYNDVAIRYTFLTTIEVGRYDRY